MKTVRDSLGGSKITADGDCTHEIKKNTLASWKKSYDQPRQNIKKHRHYLSDKSPSGQNYSFSNSHVWMLKLDDKESLVLKNWCFWTVVLEKTLESPLDCKVMRSNQLILREINPEYSLEGLMMKVKLQYFGHLMQRTDLLEKTLMLWLNAGGEGDDRGWDDCKASLTSWTWVWAGSRRWWWTGKPGMLPSMGSQRVRHDWVTELNWQWLKPWVPNAGCQGSILGQGPRSHASQLRVPWCN